MFFWTYDFLRPDEDTAFRGNEALSFPQGYEMIDLQAMPDEDGTIAFGTDGDDVILGGDAAEEIHGGAGADIIVGDGMTLADLHEMGVLSDGQLEALSLPVDPVGDVI